MLRPQRRVARLQPMNIGLVEPEPLAELGQGVGIVDFDPELSEGLVGLGPCARLWAGQGDDVKASNEARWA